MKNNENIEEMKEKRKKWKERKREKRNEYLLFYVAYLFIVWASNWNLSSIKTNILSISFTTVYILVPSIVPDT